jgi:hypothetical protein
MDKCIAPSSLFPGECDLVQDCMAGAGKRQILPGETDGTISQETAQPSSGSGTLLLSDRLDRELYILLDSLGQLA